MKRIIKSTIGALSVLIAASAWAQIAQSVPAVPAARAKVLLIGDSLCAAYGLNDPKLGWVHLVQQQLPSVQIVNACVSGQTSAAGRTQVERLLKEHKAQRVWIALGANDGLRGQPVSSLKNNLEYMVKQSQMAGAKVALFQMHMPPNYGAKYAAAFGGTYQSVSKEHNIPLVPFLLEPIALERTFFLQDQIHPNELGQKKISEFLLPVLKKIINTKS